MTCRQVECDGTRLRVDHLVGNGGPWLRSFSTKDFPENRRAKCGDRVRIVVTDIEDARPVEDVLWPDPDYRAVFAEAGLEVVAVHKPLGRAP